MQSRKHLSCGFCLSALLWGNLFLDKYQIMVNFIHLLNSLPSTTPKPHKVRGNIVHTRLPSLLTPITDSRSSPIPFSFDNLLEDSKNSLKATHLQLVYYRDRIQIKISQGKKCVRQSSEGYQTWTFQLSFPHRDRRALPCQQMCDCMHGVLPTRKPRCPEFVLVH